MVKRVSTFVFAGALASTAAMCAIVYVVMTLLTARIIETGALDAARGVAVVTADALYEVMQLGGTAQTADPVRAVVAGLSAQHPGVYDVRVHGQPARGQALPLAGDSAMAQVARTRRPFEVRVGERIRFLHPAPAAARCLGCHADVRQGALLGVVEVRHDLGPALARGRQGVLLSVLGISLLPALGAGLAAWATGRRIRRAVRKVHAGARAVNGSIELHRVGLEPVDLGFDEINEVYGEIAELVARLQQTALELQGQVLQVRVLGSCVISAESLRDWRHEVKRIVADMNAFVPVHALAALFETDRGQPELWLFWHHAPSDAVRAEVHELLLATWGDEGRRSLEPHEACGPGLGDAAGPATGSVREAFEVKRLDPVGVGGIAAIGVFGRPGGFGHTPVADSILATLAIVLGSLRAMDGYTRQIEHQAMRDSLTGLYNQRMFWEFIEYEVSRSVRHGDRFALLMADLDRFKQINDLHGHEFGDMYLRAVADALRATVRDEDVPARYGGDEFAFILPGAGLEQGTLIARRMIAALGALRVTAPDGSQVTGTASFGVAVHPDHAKTAKELFQLADHMMYRAKAGGRDRVSTPDAEDIEKVCSGTGEQHRIVRLAIAEDRIIPYFQPILELASRRIVAHEVVMRVAMPDRVVPASEWVETAEAMGVLHRMDLVLMRKAFEEVRRAGYRGALYLNLSPRALVHAGYLTEVRTIVADAGIAPAQVVFELSERDTVRNVSLLAVFVGELRSAGFSFAISDFGVGHGSYPYLRRLPVGHLKLDGEFVRGLLRAEPIDLAIIASISSLAHGLGVATVAEHVESAEALELVAAAGLTHAQGLHIGLPEPALHSDALDSRRAGGVAA